MKVEYVVKYIASNHKKYDGYLKFDYDDVASGDYLEDAVRFKNISDAAYHAGRLAKSNECTYIVVPVYSRSSE